MVGYALLANGLGYATYRIALRNRLEDDLPIPRRRIAVLGLLGGAAGALIAAMRARSLVRRPPLKGALMTVLMLQIAWLLATATPWSAQIDQAAAQIGTLAVADLGQFAHDLTQGTSLPTQLGVDDSNPDQSGPQSFWQFDKGPKSGITFVPAS